MYTSLGVRISLWVHIIISLGKYLGDPWQPAQRGSFGSPGLSFFPAHISVTLFQHESVISCCFTFFNYGKSRTT